MHPRAMRGDQSSDLRAALVKRVRDLRHEIAKCVSELDDSPAAPWNYPSQALIGIAEEEIILKRVQNHLEDPATGVEQLRKAASWILQLHAVAEDLMKELREAAETARPAI